MARTRTSFFAIPAEEIADMGLEGLMDMLRYDGARVVRLDPATEGHPRSWVFARDAEGYAPEPTVGRWASFGVKNVYLLDPKAGPFARVSDKGTLRYVQVRPGHYVAV